MNRIKSHRRSYDLDLNRRYCDSCSDANERWMSSCPVNSVSAIALGIGGKTSFEGNSGDEGTDRTDQFCHYFKYVIAIISIVATQI